MPTSPAPARAFSFVPLCVSWRSQPRPSRFQNHKTNSFTFPDPCLSPLPPPFVPAPSPPTLVSLSMRLRWWPKKSRESKQNRYLGWMQVLCLCLSLSTEFYVAKKAEYSLFLSLLQWKHLPFATTVFVFKHFLLCCCIRSPPISNSPRAISFSSLLGGGWLLPPLHLTPILSSSSSATPQQSLPSQIPRPLFSVTTGTAEDVFGFWVLEVRRQKGFVL